MGDRVQVQFPVWDIISVCDQPPRSTQPGHPVMGRYSEYQPKGGDVKAGIVHVWVAGKTVSSIVIPHLDSRLAFIVTLMSKMKAVYKLSLERDGQVPRLHYADHQICISFIVQPDV